MSALARDYPFLPQRTVRRLFRAYGTRAADVLGKARNRDDLGQDLGAGLTSREVNYLVEKEWAQNSDDVLWRRSKLGLRLLPEERSALAAYLAGLLETARRMDAPLQGGFSLQAQPEGGNALCRSAIQHQWPRF